MLVKIELVHGVLSVAVDLFDMGRDTDQTIRYHLSSSVNLTAALSLAGIEYLPVTGTRDIILYRSAVINIETVDKPLDAVNILDISVIDSPVQNESDTIDYLVELMLDQVCTAVDVDFQQIL